MATSRSFPFLRGATLGVLVLAAAAGPARAQGVLGRVRDRARQAASGAPNRTEAPATCAVSDRDRAAQADIGEDMVTRYARALHANDQEVRRIAAQNTPEGRYFA